MFTVVTSFSPEGYSQYGHQFVSTFKQFWPKSVRLICAWEGIGPEGLDGFDLLSSKSCRDFIGRHEDNPVISGLKEGSQAWSPKSKLKGYSFRHNALKFSRKVFAVGQAAKYVSRGKLFWIDADVRTHNPVSENLLRHVLPDDVALSYLARNNYHSELGFVGYNLDHPDTRRFIKAYVDMYASDAFLQEKHWDDCNIFDALVSRLRPQVRHISHKSNAQPFDNSILRMSMTHEKGRRKEAA